MERLQSQFGLTNMELDWLRCYLCDRAHVMIGQCQSDTVQLNVGASQGSDLGLLLFAVYCSPVDDVITQHGVKYHQCADDTQLHCLRRLYR